MQPALKGISYLLITTIIAGVPGTYHVFNILPVHLLAAPTNTGNRYIV